MALSQQEFDKLKARLGGDTTTSKPVLNTSQSDILAPAKEAIQGLGTLYGGGEQGIANKLKQDVQAGAKDIAEGTAKGGFSGAWQAVKGVVKAGARTAGDVAGAIYAPIGAAIQATGFNKLTDYLGKEIADMIPVSDIPAVQKFAMEHPNAGEDFGRALNLAMSKGETGKIEPNTVVARTIEQVKSAIPKVKTIPKIELPTSETTTILDRISAPNVSEATMASLNPMETFKRTGQDMRITVGGKSKMVSELTPEEVSRVKVSTTKGIDSFTKQAEKFKVDRSVKNGSPVEMVGSRADKALQVADAKRQVIGRKMGDIETQYAGDVIPMSEATYKPFVEITDAAKNPSYGTNLANSPTVAKLISDFDTLNNNGLSVAERNKFVRSWDTVLRDAKDNFGNFKENASVYTKIQNAVNKIKTETVDYLTTKDKIYRRLRKQYAEHIKLQDFGDALLGKDGLLGEKVKGAATVKRAIQSNSDMGARQFLAKLKEITGYDAIKDGDLALTAMKNVGDYQGLSLLDVLNDGKSGIIKKGLEKVQEKLVGNEAERVKKFIKK